jgi:undecaprenyl-diphosphatase
LEPYWRLSHCIGRNFRFLQKKCCDYFYIKLICAVIPALVLGKLFDDKIEAVWQSYSIAIVLILGNVLLFIDNYFQNPTSSKKKILLLKKAVTIGFGNVCLERAGQQLPLVACS